MAPAAGPAAARTFTDQYGRELAGEIVEAGDTQVKIRRADGQAITLDVAKLSDTDAAYVAQWRRDHVRFKLRLETSSFRNTLGMVAQPDTGATSRRLAAGYTVTLTNDGPDPADGLRVEYAVFQLNSDASLSRTVGAEQPATLAAKQPFVFRTKPVQFSQILSPGGPVITESFAGETAGLWVRVLRDGKVVAELVSSERVRAEGWQPPRPAAQAAMKTELHTFTDPFGRSFAGEILEADDARAKIRRDDGQIYDLEVVKLSADDDAYVARWRLDHLKFDLRVEADTFHETVGGNRSTNPSTVSQNMAAGYNLKVTNNARAPAAGLRLEYNIFVLRTGPGAPSGRVKGFAMLDPLALKQTAAIRTQPVAYTKNVATRGVASQTAELRGVWARVLFDGRVVGGSFSPARSSGLRAGRRWRPPAAVFGATPRHVAAVERLTKIDMARLNPQLSGVIRPSPCAPLPCSGSCSRYLWPAS